MAILDGMGDIVSKVSSTGKDLSWLTGSIGFIRGVTYLDRTVAQAGNPTYQTDIGWQAKDFLSNFGVAGIDTSALSGKPKGTYVSTNSPKFNLLAVVNRDTGIALALYLGKEMWGNKWTRLAYNVGFPYFAGAGAGRIFDDPVGTAQSLTTPGGNAYPVANYSNQARNGLPVNGGAPWTG